MYVEQDFFITNNVDLDMNNTILILVGDVGWGPPPLLLMQILPKWPNRVCHCRATATKWDIIHIISYRR